MWTPFNLNSKYRNRHLLIDNYQRRILTILIYSFFTVYISLRIWCCLTLKYSSMRMLRYLPCRHCSYKNIVENTAKIDFENIVRSSFVAYLGVSRWLVHRKSTDSDARTLIILWYVWLPAWLARNEQVVFQSRELTSLSRGKKGWIINDNSNNITKLASQCVDEWT